MPPTSAAASNAILLCLVSFLFPSRCYSYDMKEVQPGLVGGEPVTGPFPFFLFLLMSPLFVVLPVAVPPGRHDSDTTTTRFILSLSSPLAFAFCPSVFSMKFSSFILVTYIYTFIISLIRSLSLVFRTTMRRN